MYLQYYALGFLLFIFLDKDNCYGWALLLILCLALKCNMHFTTNIGDVRYICRTIIMSVCALLLLKSLTLFSVYQAFVLFLILVANELMLYHLSYDNYFYNNFEQIIYGLVACQFIAIIPRLWRIGCDLNTDSLASDKHKQMVDRV